MTAQQALDLIKKQLQKTEQNIELLAVLQEAVDIYDAIEDEVTYTLPKSKKILGLLDNLCVRYDDDE